MWEQLFAVDPPLMCSKDIELFVKYRDHRKFMHFMMGLREDFKPTRAFLLSWSPTSSLDVVVKELISKENRQPIHHMSSSDHVLTTPWINCTSMDKLWVSHLLDFQRYPQ